MVACQLLYTSIFHVSVITGTWSPVPFCGEAINTVIHEDKQKQETLSQYKDTYEYRIIHLSMT